MTNREAHEEAAGMNLEDVFFELSGIDPDAEYEEPDRSQPPCLECGAMIQKLTR